MLTKGIVDAYSPSHALFTLNRREDLSGVLEGYRSFSQGIADGEEINKSGERLASCEPSGAGKELTEQRAQSWRPYRRSQNPGSEETDRLPVERCTFQGTWPKSGFCVLWCRS